MSFSRHTHISRYSLKKIVFLLHFRSLLFKPSKQQHFRKDWMQPPGNQSPQAGATGANNCHTAFHSPPTQSSERQVRARWLDRVGLPATECQAWPRLVGQPVSWASSCLARGVPIPFCPAPRRQPSVSPVTRPEESAESSPFIAIPPASTPLLVSLPPRLSSF